MIGERSFQTFIHLHGIEGGRGEIRGEKRTRYPEIHEMLESTRNQDYVIDPPDYPYKQCRV
jgi:hypothetical protein